MTTEVAKKENTELTTANDMSGWGQEQEIGSKDFMISKILAMQGMSKFVTSRKAQIGEFRDSSTGELLGNIDEGLEIIPFHVDRLWVVQKQVNGKFEYSHVEPITAQNENRQWEEKGPHGTVRNIWTYTFYVVLPQDVEVGVPKPYTISFRSTSVKAGKKLMTQMFVTNKQMGKTPAHFVMKVNGVVKDNDKGTFVVLDAARGREATAEELTCAFELYKTVKAGGVKADHKDEDVSPSNFVQDNAEF